MAQGYYTLQEAAQILGMPVDDLKQMAQKGKIRSFQDRGTLRFRVQDVQELARTRGVSSEMDMVLGDASLPPAKSAASPRSAAKKHGSSSDRKQLAPVSAPKTPAKHEESVPDVFEFAFDGDKVDISGDFLPSPASEPKAKSSNRKPMPAGSDSDVRLVPDGSDVTFSISREQSAGAPDSNVKVPADPLKPKTNIHPTRSTAGKRASQLAVDSSLKAKGGGSSASRQASPRPGSSAAQPPDSGVRLVPMDSDSDEKLLGASDDVALGQAGPAGPSDSNVRLERVVLPPADSQEGNMLLTEEINLDEELKKQQEKEQPSTKLKAKSEMKLPTASPFELSESSLDFPSELEDAGPKTPVKTEADDADSSDFDISGPGPKTPAKAEASDQDSSNFDLSLDPENQEGASSEFDLTPAPSDQDLPSDFDLVPADASTALVEAGDSDDLSLEASDENEEVLQEEKTELTSSPSGISLDNPVDGGISLEEKQDDESDDFDLSLEAENTPKPQPSQPLDDADSEFELKAEKTSKPQKKVSRDDPSDDIDLSLDAEDDAPAMKVDDDTEFELNLDGSAEGAMGGAESDSEFELTLDDSGNLAVEGEEEEPQVKSKTKPFSSEEGQDIFDTDFEVPSLEESDDATVADSELESSDFDIALDDSELANEDESGSQVVALDEEEESETVADDEEGEVVDDVEVEEESSDFSDLDQDVEVGEDQEEEDQGDEGAVTSGAGRTRTVVKEKLIPPAPWGVMPVIFMLPCVIVMFLVGILGYEMVQTSAGLKPPGPLTKFLADQFGEKVTLK